MTRDKQFDRELASLTDEAIKNSLAAIEAEFARRFGKPDRAIFTPFPCAHQWAYAPTVGNMSCILCREFRAWDHPETIAYRAAYDSPHLGNAS